MIRVQGPDGNIIEFPDGTSDEVMSRAMREFYARQPAAPAEQQGPPMPEPSLLQRVGRTADDAARLLANGATFGFADKLAGMIGGDTATERARTQDARDRMGWTGTALEIGGGAGTGIGLARAGVTAARAIPQAMTGGRRLAALMGAGAVDGAALGALAGAGNTDDGEYARRMAEQAAIGGVAGAAAPALIAGVGKAVEPARDAIANMLAPEGIARRLAMRAMERSGVTPDVIRQRLADARAAGQTDYLAVDAMGDGGRRALNSVSRGDTPAASRIKELLDGRQAGQADRLEVIIREGLDAPTTGAQLVEKLKGVRSAKGAQQYGAAREAAEAVDVAPAVAALDEAIPPVTARSATARGVGESGPVATVERMRRLLTNEPVGGATPPAPPRMPDGLSPLQRAQWIANPPEAPAPPRSKAVDDFSRALLAKQEMDAAMEQGGTIAALLRPARSALDEGLASASAPYATARNTYRNLSQAIEGVDTGRQLAGRKALSQDVSQTVKEMSPQELGAARYGYADELIARLQSARQGFDKSAPLTTGKLDDDLAALSRRDVKPKLQRERDMAETRRVVTQGSQTAQNLADMGAVGVGAFGASQLYTDPTSPHGLLMAALAARRGLQRIPPSEAAREALARALMSGSADDLAAMAAKQVKARAIREDVTNPLVRALLGSGAVAVSQ